MVINQAREEDRGRKEREGESERELSRKVGRSRMDESCKDKLRRIR